MIGRIRWLLIAALLLLAVHPIFAQDAEPLTQSVQLSGGGLTLTVGYPADWAGAVGSDQKEVYIASSASALQDIQGGGDVKTPGATGIEVYLPDFVAQQLNLPVHTAPLQVLNGFIQAAHLQGSAQATSIFAIPAAIGLVANSNTPNEQIVIGAFQFPQGTVLFGLSSPDSKDKFTATIVAILNSISLTGGQSAGGGLSSLFQSTEAAATTEATEAATSAEATEAALSPANQIMEWAVKADGSSEYSDSDWNFAQATGKPDTDSCGDNGTAWAALNNNTREYLRVTFAKPVIPSQINIYQTYTPGAIVEVDLGNSANPDKVLPLPNSADPPGNTPCPGVFSINVTGVNTPIDFVVLYVDQTITGDYDEIDAVQLVGTPAS